MPMLINPFILGAAVVVSDTFTRANDATTMGNAETGQAWVPNSGTWGISSNAAYNPSNGAQVTTVVESGLADCTITVTLPVSGDVGLCWRSTDDNNHWLFANSTGNMYKKVAGGFTQVGSSAGAGANGDVIQVVLLGNSITLKRNGVTVVTGTDAFNNTATKHGLRANGGFTARFDDFSIAA